jgi:hypothetical protein
VENCAADFPVEPKAKQAGDEAGLLREPNRRLP